MRPLPLLYHMSFFFYSTFAKFTFHGPKLIFWLAKAHSRFDSNAQAYCGDDCCFRICDLGSVNVALSAHLFEPRIHTFSSPTRLNE